MCTNVIRAAALIAGLMLTFPAAPAQLPDPGARLPATGGVTQIEGAAGGGLVPWALIAGYGTRDEIGLTAFYTRVDPTDFMLQSFGVALGVHDRVELSVARQRLGLGTTVPGQAISQDIVGLKVKLFGDAIFDQDRALPQVALGLQYKNNIDMAVPRALGAKDSRGVDVYLAATKVWLAGLLGRSVVLDATLRATRANQMGLLGFGGDANDGYRLMPEISGAVFLTDRVLLGAEYRTKPSNLNAFAESDFSDVFVAFVPCKRIALTAAYAYLGQIADKRNQQALYLSAQVSF